mmetsp:Transcript_49965/g.88822  ORF Transcript_49965/g.88822 Transcript_49965/m.88822 type:complete len:411 (-) Transcript_49965:56-1288(-)
MFDSLKKNLATAASAAQAGANSAMSAAKDRLDTAQAAKKLLDEGGEPMAAKLLAKKASTDVVYSDTKFFNIDLQHAFGQYCVAAQAMKEALDHAAGESPTFADLANKYDARAAEFKAILDTLRTIPEKVSVSPVEKDATAIVVTKTTASGAAAGVRKSLTGLLGGAGGAGGADASNASNAPSGGYPEGGAAAAGSSSSGGYPTGGAVGSWLSNAANSTKERVQTAMPGKSMVDEGGEPMVAKLLAKKASVDATSFDTKLMPQLAVLVGSYYEAAKKLRESAASSAGESPAFEALAAQYEARSSALKRAMDGLSAVPAPATVSVTEKNAIIYMVAHLKVKDAKTKVTGTVQEVQARGVEAAIGSALSGATGGRVSSVPEGTGRAAVQVAKENPELAKAAVGAAAKAAAKPN